MEHPGPVVAITAATVLLLRDAVHGSEGNRLEVFMMRRSLTMPFAPGMYVFPGGRVERIDAVAPAPALLPVAIEAAQRSGLGVPDMTALLHCAAREVAEESGVQVRPESLTLVGRWVTPEFEPRRYDVHFFAVELREDQVPYSASSETDEAGWYPPSACLEAFGHGNMAMLPPTLAMVDACRQHATVQEFLTEYGARRVRAHLPRPISQDRELWCVIDADTQEVLIERIRRPRVRETDSVELHWEDQ